MVVTGHSLGAAVATLLGMQLRERFTDLQCWAFNPPGGLLSWELAQIAERYCTSVVVGKDVISRLR
jgi:sn1-specific diacylglycerol lipase